MPRTRGIYAATQEEAEELLRLIEQINGNTLETVMGWIANSDKNTAVDAAYAIRMLRDGVW